MPKFIISWDAGFGVDGEIIEAPDEAAAVKEAYQRWHDAAENQAVYSAVPYSKEAAEDLLC